MKIQNLNYQMKFKYVAFRSRMPIKNTQELVKQILKFFYINLAFSNLFEGL